MVTGSSQKISLLSGIRFMMSIVTDCDLRPLIKIDSDILLMLGISDLKIWIGSLKSVSSSNLMSID